MPQGNQGEQGQLRQFQTPASAQRIPGFPESFQLATFDGFDGLNTKPTRSAIADDECFILDGFIPLGRNNARTLYDKGTTLFTAASGTSVSFFGFGNIADTSYGIVVQANGAVVATNIATQAERTIAPAGTIADPTQAIGLSQFGSQYIILATPQGNGYFLWDGSLFYKAGTVGPVVALTAGGGGYTSAPSVTAYGGNGSSTAFTATVNSAGSVTLVTVTSAGTGYQAQDVVALAFAGGGGVTGTTAIATAGLTGGRVTSASITNAGSGYTAQTLVSIQGGGGTGATAICTASGGVTAVTLVSPGGGYFTAPTILFTDTGNQVARAAVAVMPFGVSGTTVETYANRSWIANGAAPTSVPPRNREIFSAASNPADFNTADGAGAFLATDSFLRVGVYSLKQSNGFLYEIGDSSVNYISGVTTSGNPSITTFTNQNIDPQVGTPWPLTAQVFGRAIVFANTFGVHALYGGAVQKVSNQLDGIYSTVTPTGAMPSFGGMYPSAAVATIFGIHVYILLLPIVDQVTGAQTNKLLMWDGKRWWTASQSGNSITQIATLEINSQLTAYGTDGHIIFPMFQTASNAITKTIQSKFWDNPSYIMQKVARYAFGLFKTFAAEQVGFTVTVESETQASSATRTGLFTVNVTNSADATVTILNNAAAVVTIFGIGTARFQQKLANEVTGSLIGLTLSTTAQDFSLISLLAVGAQNKVDL